MKNLSSRTLGWRVSLIGMTLLLLYIPFSPGCICVEDFPTDPLENLRRVYQGYMVADDASAAVIFRLDAAFQRNEGVVEGTITVIDDSTAVYQLLEVDREGMTLTFQVTIPDLAFGQLELTTDFGERFLTGTYVEVSGPQTGLVIGAAVEVDRSRTDSDMVGAYELVGSATDTDTVTGEFEDDLFVRMEFEPDGLFSALSRDLSDSSEYVDTGSYSLMGDLLLITLDGEQADFRLPVSMRGFIVNKDIVLLSYPRPFPSFDAVIPVADGIQVEHFRQGI